MRAGFDWFGWTATLLWGRTVASWGWPVITTFISIVERAKGEDATLLGEYVRTITSTVVKRAAIAMIEADAGNRALALRIAEAAEREDAALAACWELPEVIRGAYAIVNRAIESFLAPIREKLKALE